ncbi:CubicO group peptidase (beta-lactamase class C family) [Flavobacterium sp. 90]|uniref:serine hydrolase domain-containing protein n=1 Tax=unclassified Flavobacterium TaxID=196869 RepID=UPI000EB0A031|nr:MULTISPECIES: serine hydrolase domain-containing protein [unclassified Flavobacterium]RKR08284.1 CubicO group peptidase (beta-lactamase class C family) [Flavobacterium sp. 81]TCK57472.1 CubicO group peptidase (beta-lactamase class C family) [Flavobacterium sp. 90]
MKHKFPFLPITLLLFFVSNQTIFAQKDNYSAKIDSLIKTSSVRPFNGAILVSQKEKIKYSKAYGYSDFTKKTPLKLDDPFVILSNSKQITAVLILQEVEKGKIVLITPIKKYLPNLKQPWTSTVTVENLLNHTSGIADLDKPTIFPAGTQFKYSDLNYILLAQIIERVTNKTYENVVTELFKKNNMRDSFFPNDSNKDEVVNGRQFSKDNTTKEIKGVIVPRERIPAAGLVSTVEDLAIWNNLLHNAKLLNVGTYGRMTSYTITNQHSVFGDKEIGYGYGIRINDESKIKEFGHTGIVPDQGFTSVNLYYPKTQTSIIILENQAFDNLDISYYFESEIRKIVLNSGLLD